MLFGCGGNRDISKRPIMGRLVEQYAYFFYITPDNPRYENQEKIVKDILTGLSSQNFEVYTDRGDALRKALSGLKKDDVLVVLGKGRETYQEVEDVRLPYSDIEIIEEFCENSNS